MKKPLGWRSDASSSGCLNISLPLMPRLPSSTGHELMPLLPGTCPLQHYRKLRAARLHATTCTDIIVIENHVALQGRRNRRHKPPSAGRARQAGTPRCDLFSPSYSTRTSWDATTFVLPWHSPLFQRMARTLVGGGTFHGLTHCISHGCRRSSLSPSSSSQAWDS